MNAVRTYLAMGGYAGFVWPAYAITVIVLGGLAVVSLLRYRAGERVLARLQRELPQRRDRRGVADEGERR